MTSKLPPIQPHTQAKHEILRYYVNQWFPILGSTQTSLRYIDGFAGPGDYEGGEPGSPIIVLRVIEQHQQFAKFSKAGNSFEFLFVEKDPDYYQNLERKISAGPWASTFSIDVEHAEFEEVMTQLVDGSATRQEQMPPTLVFIDPFGPAGFSMKLLERLASFKRMEVLINLNCNEFIQWVPSDPSKHVTADRLYGGPRWRPAINLSGHERITFLVQEYEEALREIGWRGTSFEMVNRQNQTAYHLVFGTGSPKGMEAMKRAMRNASPTGEFRYTDRVDPAQPVLLGLGMADEYPREIGEHLFRKYEGQEVAFDRLVEEDIDWDRWWLTTDLKAALKHLEYCDEPRIANVRKSDGRRRRERSYPDGCLITFQRSRQGRLL